jgi:hypothetical protein
MGDAAKVGTTRRPVMLIMERHLRPPWLLSFIELPSVGGRLVLYFVLLARL